MCPSFVCFIIYVVLELFMLFVFLLYENAKWRYYFRSSWAWITYYVESNRFKFWFTVAHVVTGVVTIILLFVGGWR